MDYLLIGLHVHNRVLFCACLNEVLGLLTRF